MGTSTKTKHIFHPKPDLSFGTPFPSLSSLFFGGGPKNRQKPLFKKTTTVAAPVDFCCL